MFDLIKKSKKYTSAVLLALIVLANFPTLVAAQPAGFEGSSVGGSSVAASDGKASGEVGREKLNGGANSGNWITNGILGATSKVVGVVAWAIAFMVEWIAGKVFVFLGYAIEAAINMNSTITSNPLITIGWTLLRDLANLGFILTLIFIAFATMLRVEAYGIKRMFVNIVVVAILINFSLVIGGLVVNASNQVTDFFIEKSADYKISTTRDDLAKYGDTPATNMVINLASATNISSLLKTSDINFGDYVGAFELNENFFNLFAGLVFAAIFTLLGAMSLGAIMIMTFIRYFVITGLLIVAPLAWLSYAVPPVADYFKKWWEKLFQWSFFMPIMMFFLYLAVVMSQSVIVNDVASPYSITKSSAANFAETALGGMFGDYLHMIITIAIMIMGLIAGERLGLGMSKTSISVATRVKNGGLGILGMGTGVAGWAPRALLSGGLNESGTTRGERLATGIASTPVIRTVFGGIAPTIDRLSKFDKSPVEASKNKYKDLNKNLLIQKALNENFDEADAAGIVSVLADKGALGDLSKLDNKKLIELVDKGKNYGSRKDLQKVRPDLLISPDDIKKAMAGISAKDKADLDPIVYNNIDVVLSLKNGDLKKISEANKYQTMENINKSIQAIVDSAINLPAGAAMTPEQRSALRIDDYINNDPLWT